MTRILAIKRRTRNLLAVAKGYLQPSIDTDRASDAAPLERKEQSPGKHRSLLLSNR
jgi:hypothetical protein